MRADHHPGPIVVHDAQEGDLLCWLPELRQKVEEKGKEEDAEDASDGIATTMTGCRYQERECTYGQIDGEEIAHDCTRNAPTRSHLALQAC